MNYYLPNCEKYYSPAEKSYQDYTPESTNLVPVKSEIVPNYSKNQLDAPKKSEIKVIEPPQIIEQKKDVRYNIMEPKSLYITGNYAPFQINVDMGNKIINKTYIVYNDNRKISVDSNLDNKKQLI